jgi:putative SOS response-associated peptidase YedK
MMAEANDCGETWRHALLLRFLDIIRRNGVGEYSPCRRRAVALVPATEPAFTTKLSTINARSESIFQSRLYRDLVIRQRAIIPLSPMGY